MNVHIRRIEKEDINVVSEIVCRNFMEINIKDYPREEMEYLCQTYTPQKIIEISDYAHMYVACLENEVVGCGAIHSSEGKEDESILRAVFVLPELQGRGIGKEILKKLEEDKLFLRAKRVKVLASITACDFYLKMGYTYKDGIKELDGDGLYHLEKLKIEKIFKSDFRYKVLIDSYNRFDGMFAIFYYALLMIAYYVMGVIYTNKDIYLGIHMNIALVSVVICFMIFRKQKKESIGFGERNIKKSIALGIVTASIVFLINLIPGAISGRELNSVSKLLSNFIYYFLIIALVEEIVFRGFLQTRIYGIIKKPTLAIFLVAFMFMSMHIPFQMGRANMDLLTFVSNNYITLLFQFGWHFVFNSMYVKYNSIVAPTIFHTFMNWSNYLFV